MSAPTPPLRVPTLEEFQQQEINRLKQDLADAQQNNAANNSWRSRLVSQLPLLATLVTVLIRGYNALISQSQYRDSAASTRFQNAVTLLSGGDLTTRLGGIYLLGQVAQASDSDSQQESAVRLIATYLRVKFPASDATRAAPLSNDPAVEEVRAAFTVLGNRGKVTLIDVSRINARNLNAPRTDFRGLIFTHSDLSGSEFEDSNFEDVILLAAPLKRVNLSGADFKNAVLNQANLSASHFGKADLTGASLQGGNLSGADLSEVSGLTASQLKGASLSSATKLPSGLSVP